MFCTNNIDTMVKSSSLQPIWTTEMNSYDIEQPLDLRLKAINLTRQSRNSLQYNPPRSSFSSSSSDSLKSNVNSNGNSNSIPLITRQHSLVSRYNCKPCGIVFSHLETLRAHQEGYCTKRDRTQTPQVRSQSAFSPMPTIQQQLPQQQSSQHLSQQQPQSQSHPQPQQQPQLQQSQPPPETRTKHQQEAQPQPAPQAQQQQPPLPPPPPPYQPHQSYQPYQHQQLYQQHQLYQQQLYQHQHLYHHHHHQQQHQTQNQPPPPASTSSHPRSMAMSAMANY